LFDDKKIDLMIVGAQKAGTTSLLRYLSEHPRINGQITKEFSYFIDDIEYNKDFNTVFNNYYNNKSAKVIVAKNAGLYVSEKGLKRLKKYNPDCKIVFIIREPVSRTISSYKMEVNSGWLKQSFSELPYEIEKHKKGEYSLMYKLFVKQSLYVENLNLIYKYFDKNNVNVFLFEDLKSNSEKVCKQIFYNLKIYDDFVPNFKIIHNKSSFVKNQKLESLLHKLRNENNLVKRIIKIIIPFKTYLFLVEKINKINKTNEVTNEIIIDNETVDFLKSFYKRYNMELSNLIGIDLSHWNK